MPQIERTTVAVWTAAGASASCLVAAVALTWQAGKMSAANDVQAVKLDSLKEQVDRLSEDVREIRGQVTLLLQERPNGDK